jgi:hypothetical protein
VAYNHLRPALQLAPRIVIWIGVLLAFEQCVHAIVLLISLRRNIRFSLVITPKFRLPVGVALAWVIFTALSIDLVVLTYRSNAAVLAKTLHVASEVTFLILLSSAFGFYVFSAICIFAVLIILLMVLTLPCSETVLFAASSGLILDSINFLAYAWYGLSNPRNIVLWTLIGGFGWHSLYLLTYLGVIGWTAISDTARVWIRVAGLTFNIIASELLLTASKRALGLTRGGMMAISEWMDTFDPLREPLCVWTTEGLRFVGPVPDDKIPRHVSQFELHKTGYTRGNLHKALLGLLPCYSSVHYVRDGDVTTIKSSILCMFCTKSTIVDIQYITEREVFVLSWNHIRYASWVLLVVLGIAIGILR